MWPAVLWPMSRKETDACYGITGRYSGKEGANNGS